MLFHKNEAIPEYYEFFNSVKIISGYKALENIPFELSRVGAKRPIIITDKGVQQAGLVKVVIDSFGGSDTVIGAVFDETPQDSSNIVEQVYAHCLVHNLQDLNDSFEQASDCFPGHDLKD